MSDTPTVGHMTAKHSYIEVSHDGATWTGINGSVSAVTPSGGDHMTGTLHVFGGHWPLIGIGKRNPSSWTIRYPYTEVENEFTDLVDGYFENQDPVYIRWRPKGNAAGNWQFVGWGYFLNPVHPASDSTTGDLLANEVTWFGTEVERSVAT